MMGQRASETETVSLGYTLMRQYCATFLPDWTCCFPAAKPRIIGTFRKLLTLLRHRFSYSTYELAGLNFRTYVAYSHQAIAVHAQDGAVAKLGRGSRKTGVK